MSRPRVSVDKCAGDGCPCHLAKGGRARPIVTGAVIQINTGVTIDGNGVHGFPPPAAAAMVAAYQRRMLNRE